MSCKGRRFVLGALICVAILCYLQVWWISILMRVPRLTLLVKYFSEMAMKPEVNARLLQASRRCPNYPRGVSVHCTPHTAVSYYSMACIFCSARAGILRRLCFIHLETLLSRSSSSVSFCCFPSTGRAARSIFLPGSRTLAQTPGCASLCSFTEAHTLVHRQMRCLYCPATVWCQSDTVSRL